MPVFFKTIVPVWAACGLLAVGWLSGCASHKLNDSVFGPGYQPANVMCKNPKLPSEVRRVAVLPLAIPFQRPAFEHGLDTLEPVLQAELKKTGRFECRWISRADAQSWTGQAQWLTDEKLPTSFFNTLRTETGCDAVLFCELREYRPYPPLATGWRFRLVDQTGKDTLWAADEVFDAGDGTVVNAARRYQQDHEELPAALQDSRTILNSPRRFGQYTAASLLATLPAR